MKRSLLALAVLGAFAGVASAQSSVTIYGRIDQAIVKGNGGTVTGVAGGTATGAQVMAGNGNSEAWQLRSNGTSPRLGFRGKEDLGGGLTAHFTIEHRFTADTGATTAADTFWEGQSIVGLSHAAAGEIILGRIYSPAFYIISQVDPFGLSGIGQIGSTVGYAGFGGSRIANSVTYKTPSFGGFVGKVATSLGEGAAGVGRRDAVSAEYTSGPIYAGLAYERFAGGTIANSADGDNLINFSFSYNFSGIKPYFLYAQSKTGAGNNTKNIGWATGLSAKIGPGALKVNLVGFDRGDPSTGVTAASAKQAKFGIGYDYFLSKRTRVYADFASASQEKATTATVDPEARTQVAVGMRHDF